MSDYTFHHHLDSVGFDLNYIPNKTIEELKEICSQDERCLAFNSLGYIKNFVVPEKEFRKIPDFKDETDGLYVHNERCKNFIEKKPEIFEDYTFYPNKDSVGNDIYSCTTLTIPEMKNLADTIPNCVAFNTIGYFKYAIGSDFKEIRPEISGEGLYVKKDFLENSKERKRGGKIKIKFICNWCDCSTLKKEWSHMSQSDDGTWNNIEMTENQFADFYVIINKPWPNEYYDPVRTIIFQMEPWCSDPKQNWGVKTWGEWARPDPGEFLQVRTHDKFVNNCLWQLSLTYNQLKNNDFSEGKINKISTICSSKYFDPGHIKRIDFIKYIELQNDPDVSIDIYNYDNEHDFKGYQGPHPPGQKEKGMVKYKYYFMAENNAEYNFITEKIWEPLITETLCFYWGCPNIIEHIDPRAYIVLDLNNFSESFKIVKNAILQDEWSKRIDIIKQEKQRVLDYYNVFPTLERVLEKEMALTSGMTNEEIIYAKYFYKSFHKNDQKSSHKNDQKSFHKNDNSGAKTVCFFHNCLLNKGKDIFNEYMKRFSSLLTSIDKLFIVNLGDDLRGDFREEYSNDKIEIINYSPNVLLYEIPTLNLIRVFSKFNPEAKILYVHSKGVTHDDYTMPKIKDWVDYMLFFLVDNHKICLDLLDNYDTVGCNLLQNPAKHYSGNFWWANSSWIQKLSKVSGDRHQAEWWICSGQGDHHSIYNSGVNHYQTRYPRELYSNFNLYPELDSRIRIKCINLERRPDRKQNVEQLLIQHQLLEKCDFFKAIDGKKLEATDDIKELFHGNDFQNRRSFIGCALSHYTLWKQLLQDDHEYFLILEDDIKFADRNITMGINRALEMAENNGDWDIIYLGHHIRGDSLDKYKQDFGSQNTLKLISHQSHITIGGIFGYLLSKSGAKKFLNYISENGIKHGIDYVMFKFEKEMKLKNYEVVPRLILSDFVDYQNSVDSDIQYDVNSLW